MHGESNKEGLPLKFPAAPPVSSRRCKASSACKFSARQRSLLPIHAQRLLGRDLLALLQFLCHQVYLPLLTEPLWGPRVYMHIPGQCPWPGCGRRRCTNCGTCEWRDILRSSSRAMRNQKIRRFVENFNAAFTNCTCGRGSSAGCGPPPAAALLLISPAWPAPVPPAPSAAQTPRFPYPD